MPEVPPSIEPPGADPLGAVGRLHEDNERLRLRVLELLKLMEDEVTDRVDAEIRAEDWERQAGALERELEALRSTTLFRMAAPLRSIYARFRSRG